MMTTDAHIGRALRAVELAEHQPEAEVKVALLEMAESWLMQAQAMVLTRRHSELLRAVGA